MGFLQLIKGSLLIKAVCKQQRENTTAVLSGAAHLAGFTTLLSLEEEDEDVLLHGRVWKDLLRGLHGQQGWEEEGAEWFLLVAPKNVDQSHKPTLGPRSQGEGWLGMGIFDTAQVFSWETGTSPLPCQCCREHCPGRRVALGDSSATPGWTILTPPS